MVASVGSPPSISRAGAGACTTPSSHWRQAYFGRIVTSTVDLASSVLSSRSLAFGRPMADAEPAAFLPHSCRQRLKEVAGKDWKVLIPLSQRFTPEPSAKRGAGQQPIQEVDLPPPRVLVREWVPHAVLSIFRESAVLVGSGASYRYLTSAAAGRRRN